MAFERAVVDIRPASVGTGIKMALAKRGAKPALMRMTLSAAVAKTLNIGDGDGVEVMIGTGTDHGLMRLRKNNSAAVVRAKRNETGKGAWVALRLGHQAAFPDEAQPAQWCQWETLDDGWTEVVLPRWAGRRGARGQRAASAEGCMMEYDPYSPRGLPDKARQLAGKIDELERAAKRIEREIAG